MRRTIAIASALCFAGATAIAQVADGEGSNRTSHGKGSTGPTFPIPGPDSLIAVGPALAGVNTGSDGQPVPRSLGGDHGNSGAVSKPVGAAGPTR